MARRTVAEIVARVCLRHGVERVFGVPGGGSSLDLLAAFAAVGIPYILTRTETAAVIMAAATAEVTGTIGVAITTQGPGTASATNGVAQASLDRSPVLLISDGWTARQAAFDTHQVFDQRALMAPLTKVSSRLEGADPAAELEAMVVCMTTEPWGPAYLELTGEAARREVEDAGTIPDSPDGIELDEAALAAAAAMLARSRQPVVLVGLEARARAAAEAVAGWSERLGAPVLPTYKAKGVIPDGHPNLVGMFTGGAAEQPCVGEADLIVCCGLDPVELIGRPWPYHAPVLELGPVRHAVHYFEPAVRVQGPLQTILQRLGQPAGNGWDAGAVARHRAAMATRLAYPVSPAGTGISPQTVVAMAAAAAPDARVTVDAGAHMFSAMAFWPAHRPGDVLISNGLATMAFSLPAAIALSLDEPGRPLIAFTGDGGLMMCAGELSTAAEHGAKLCIVVFNDASLSLIAIKQQARQMSRAGVDWPRADFAAVARGFGLDAWTVRTEAEYGQALLAALASGGPSLLDVQVDSSGYLAQSVALRG